jgi:hypothetical protein
MRISHRLGAAALAACLALPVAAHAALEKALNEADTSTGLLPTSTLNKWKLQTDPAIVNSSVVPSVDLSTYEPVMGSLCDSFDPTEFALDMNPSTEQYGLGYSVVGLGAFEVTQFTVQLTDGSVNVKAGAKPGDPDIVTQTGGGTPTGNVLDIDFQLRTDGVPQPANQDQLFYELELTQIGEGNPYNPGGQTFPDSNSFITIEPIGGGTPVTIINDPTNPTNPEFIDSSTSVPEPGSAKIMLGAGGMAALASIIVKKMRKLKIA